MGRAEVVTTRAPAAAAGSYRTDWIPIDRRRAVAVRSSCTPSTEVAWPLRSAGPRTSLQLHLPDAPPRTRPGDLGADRTVPTCHSARGASAWHLCLAAERGRSVVLSIGPNAREATPALLVPFRQYARGQPGRSDALGILLARGRIPAARARAAGAAAEPAPCRLEPDLQHSPSQSSCSGGRPARLDDDADGGDDLPALSRHPSPAASKAPTRATFSRPSAREITRRCGSTEGQDVQIDLRQPPPAPPPGHGPGPARLALGPLCPAPTGATPRKYKQRLRRGTPEGNPAPGRCGETVREPLTAYRRYMEPTWTIDDTPSMTTSASSTSPSE